MVGDVLVVEDTPEMSELMKTYLELEGLSVMEARTAEAAQDILGSSVYDLIILDLNLPGIDGFEFLQWLRA